MKKFASFIFLICISLMVVFVADYVDNSSWVMEEPSPSGEYSVVQYCTSAFSISYRGKVYLEAEDKKIYLNNWAPTTCYWESEDIFVLMDWRYNPVRFSVNAYLTPEN